MLGGFNIRLFRVLTVIVEAVMSYGTDVCLSMVVSVLYVVSLSGFCVFVGQCLRQPC